MKTEKASERLKQKKLIKKKTGPYVPWPSPSRGDSKSIEGLNAPAAFAARAKCCAPIIFPLQKLLLVSGSTSHFPLYFGTGPYGSVL